VTVLARVPETLRWQNDVLYILDQRALPHSEEELALTTIEEVRDAIIRLVVRGAPAIGIAAAYGMLLGLKEFPLNVLQNVCSPVDTIWLRHGQQQ
jgi:methylthioribose-1-phosphate isomerase